MTLVALVQFSFRSTSKSQSKRKVNWFEWTSSKSKSQM